MHRWKATPTSHVVFILTICLSFAFLSKYIYIYTSICERYDIAWNPGASGSTSVRCYTIGGAILKALATPDTTPPSSSAGKSCVLSSKHVVSDSWYIKTTKRLSMHLLLLVHTSSKRVLLITVQCAWWMCPIPNRSIVWCGHNIALCSSHVSVSRGIEPPERISFQLYFIILLIILICIKKCLVLDELYTTVADAH